MSEADMFNLKRQVEEERQLRENSEDSFMPERSVEEWLSRRKLKQTTVSTKGDLKAEEDTAEDQAESDVPPQLLSIPDLPPSLLPPPPGGWKVKVNTEWG